ncbi:MAG: hypothetical protein RLY11_203 [Bacteroidota bacterium]|jgi:uncharacterized iron-regulated membrane protein
MAKSKHFYIRKSHRYLGLILGIQFLLWTTGGLYFSWSNMDEVHGDLTKKNAPYFSVTTGYISPSVVIDSLKSAHSIDSLVSLQLIEILGTPHYQIKCLVNKLPTSYLANAENGVIRPALSRSEAIEVARNRFNGEAGIKSVVYLERTAADHEYRENPLPAYGVTFNDNANTTVYVASELGTIQKFRNNKWRIFDFLWMLHTMNYEDRDTFGNILLRSFSILGLITIISGFWLFFITQKKKF